VHDQIERTADIRLQRSARSGAVASLERIDEAQWNRHGRFALTMDS
jgi:hypothetical protein